MLAIAHRNGINYERCVSILPKMWLERLPCTTAPDEFLPVLITPEETLKAGDGEDLDR